MAPKLALLTFATGLLPPVAAIDRLTITNGCLSEPIWIAHLANVGVGPGKQNVKIEPGASFTFSDMETDGLAGARYWPKMGCDEQGNNCQLGGSGGPTQACVKGGSDYSQCAPPIDTKFEATWGRQGQPCNPAIPSQMSGCDFVDISLVDGWTLPFKLEVLAGKCTGTAESSVTGIDCSGLTVDKCPQDDDLGQGPVNMQAISPHSGKPAGCYGPCLKLIDDKWGNEMAKGRKRDDPDVVPYCCTTPPLDSASCNAGPIGSTKYVQSVHELCPGVYGFAYDDGMGLMRCSYGQYKMTFYCPTAAPMEAAATTAQAAAAGPPTGAAPSGTATGSAGMAAAAAPAQAAPAGPYAAPAGLAAAPTAQTVAQQVAPQPAAAAPPAADAAAVAASPPGYAAYPQAVAQFESKRVAGLGHPGFAQTSGLFAAACGLVIAASIGLAVRSYRSAHGQGPMLQPIATSAEESPEE